ncbi:MAG: hypothetical protein RLY97_673 [Pseudomonadota bacterium]
MLYAKSGNALRLTSGDAQAVRAGLCAGMSLADARARFPHLIAVEQDSAADSGWLARLGQDCLGYTPQVTLLPPDAIGMDITGSAHLFGGELAMVDMVLDRFNDMGMTTRAACGITPEAAAALARYADWPMGDEAAAIRGLPLDALGLDDAARRGLQRAGLTSVGAVASRPMAAIAARFGMAAVDAIERLTGLERAPMTAIKPPAPLHFTRRFAEPVTHQSAIARSLLALLQDAACVLEKRGQGGRRFRLTLLRSDGARHRLDIATSAPTRDPALVLRLFDERIATLADPLDPGFGYDQMQLAIGAVEGLVSVQATFVGEEGAQDGGEQAIAELIDRLSTRLGPDCIQRLAPQDSHIPEQAQLALPASTNPAPLRWPAPPIGEPPLRPLFLFDPPQRIEVIAEVPDGPPHRFRWRRGLHEVRLYEGPERIAGEWWRRRGGEQAAKAGLTRDYYRIEDMRGRRFWLFRHGLYAEKPDPRWYLHGLFA